MSTKLVLCIDFDILKRMINKYEVGNSNEHDAEKHAGFGDVVENGRRIPIWRCLSFWKCGTSILTTFQPCVMFQRARKLMEPFPPLSDINVHSDNDFKMAAQTGSSYISSPVVEMKFQPIIILWRRNQWNRCRLFTISLSAWNQDGGYETESDICGPVVLMVEILQCKHVQEVQFSE